MIQYFDFIEALLGKEPDPEHKLLRTVERLYFGYVRHPFRQLRRSEEARVAADILAIDDLLAGPASLATLEITSKRFAGNELLRHLQRKPKLDRTDIAQLEADHLGHSRYYVTAVFVTHLIQSEHRKERFRWLFTILLSVIATLLAALIKLAGDIYARL